jgi:V-type H+-transporting ATPase subunit C
MQTYSTLGATIASFGGPNWTKSTTVGQDDGKFGPALDRSKVKGSPVVPGSARKLAEEGEYVMFAVTILRGEYHSGIIADDVFTPGTIDR